MGRYRKNKFTVAIFLILFFCLSYEIKSESFDRVVGIVGEEAITLSELRKILKLATNDDFLKVPKDIQDKALESIIETKLVEQKAKNSGMAVADREVDDEIENVKKNNNLTTEALIEVLKKENLTMEEYREKMKLQILKAKLVNREVRSNIAVSDELIKQYYEREIASGQKPLYNFDVMTVYYNKEKKKALDSDIKDYYKYIKKGDSFDEVGHKAAKYYKVLITSPRNVKPESLASELRDALKDMREGDLGQLIRFSDGYQIFKFVGKSFEGLKPIEAIKEELKNKYMSEKMDKTYKEWLDGLKKEIYVEKRL